MVLSSLSLRAALLILTAIFSVTAINIQPVSSDIYGLQITLTSNLPVDITIKSAEIQAYVNSELVAYGTLSNPITIRPHESGVIIGQVTFNTPLSELIRMPNETPVVIVASIKYSIWIIPKELHINEIVTIGQLAAMCSSC